MLKSLGRPLPKGNGVLLHLVPEMKDGDHSIRTRSVNCLTLGGSKPSPLGDSFSSLCKLWAWPVIVEARTVFAIHLHLVWVTKYRRPVLTGAVGARVRDLIREICRVHEVEIAKGHVSRDHVHLFVSIPPQVAISCLVPYLKGKSSHRLLAEFAHLRKAFFGRHLWARGYFCCSSGNVTDELVKAYIAAGRSEDHDDNFHVEGEAGPATTSPPPP